MTWGDDEMSALAKTLRRGLFLLHVAVNKLDLAPEGVMDHLTLDVARRRASRTWSWPCDAQTRRGSSDTDGDVDFEVSEDAPLSGRTTCCAGADARGLFGRRHRH